MFKYYYKKSWFIWVFSACFLLYMGAAMPALISAKSAVMLLIGIVGAVFCFFQAIIYGVWIVNQILKENKK